MVRAGVFIGVDRTGQLPRLHDAAAGAKRMYDWAVSQGMAERTHAKLITDDGGAKVSPDLIYERIAEIVDGAGVDQLIVYFAGHGININRTEHWLLSDAPVRTNAAVNVSGSVELARYCGIQHVVIVSDACRVAPEGIQAQNVRGDDIFPNNSASDKAKPVDQFFACRLGGASAEISDPSHAADSYTALYTHALLDGLYGTVPDVLVPSALADDGAHYVRPRKLQTYLEREVPRRIRELKLQHKVNQDPDAIILDHSYWLARIQDPMCLARGFGPEIPKPSEDRGPRKPPRPARASSAGDSRLRLPKRLASRPDVLQLVNQLATPFGPDHIDTLCGIKSRSRRIVECFSPRSNCQIVGPEGNLVRVESTEGPASILLRFEGGVGTVIPAMPGFIAALTFSGDGLVDVAYEPSSQSWRMADFRTRAAEIRELRAIAAASSQHGRFQLKRADADKVARRMQTAEGVDLTLSVYAAYAYHDLQDLTRISDMAGYQCKDIEVMLFDVALLARKLVGKSIGPRDRIVPFTPLLSQGWALLRANRIGLHPALEGIERTMRPSLWSLFDRNGVELLRRAMHTREVL